MTVVDQHRDQQVRVKVESIRERADRAHALLESCQLCPRRCGANRLNGGVGFCGGGKELRVASCSVHYGEEPPISGTRGSGTVFFSGCSLRCKYCQNFPISQMRYGREMPTQRLADMMLRLQSKGCHNVNLVTPSHFVPQILKAVSLAQDRGFDLPLVYNSSGYDSIDSLRLLEGVVDVYLPDMRYSKNAVAEELSSAENYVEVNRDAVREMHRQVGELRTDEQGIATRGLIIRHLVLPNNLAGSDETFRFIREEISQHAHVSLMGQYFPSFRAGRCVSIDRKITPEEYETAVESFFGSDLSRGWMQEGSRNEVPCVEE